MLGRRDRKASRAGGRNGRLRLFYCGDIHGSDVCFRKFINAGAHYEADVLILGGDITGKALVPIVRDGERGWRCYLHGQERTGVGEEDLAAVRKAIAARRVLRRRDDRGRAGRARAGSTAASGPPSARR